MATILEFPELAEGAQQKVNTRPSKDQFPSETNIVIFPGIRRERTDKRDPIAQTSLESHRNIEQNKQ